MFSMLTGRSRSPSTRPVRSEVASAALWGAEIRGIDGSVAPSPTGLLPSVWDRCLGLLGDVVPVSVGTFSPALAMCASAFASSEWPPMVDHPGLWQMRLSRALSCSWGLRRPFAALLRCFRLLAFFSHFETPLATA